MNKFFYNNNSKSNISRKQILSNDVKISNSVNNNESKSINDNSDKIVKMNSAHNKENKMADNKRTKSKTNIHYFYSNKFLLIIIIFFIICDNNGENQIDLKNYLDKIYGEEDLLKIIKEKEREKVNFSHKKRYKIEKEIENIYDTIEKIKKKEKRDN